MRKLTLIVLSLAFAACSESEMKPPVVSAPTTTGDLGSAPPTIEATPSLRSRPPKQAKNPGPTTGTDGSQSVRSSSAPPPPSSTQASSGGVTSPSGGSYRYAQSGYEEFCQSAACDRSNLPDVQTVGVRYERRSSKRSVVIVHARISQRSSTRTTYEFTRAAARILRSSVIISTTGFDYTTTYTPEPAIRAAIFPLDKGKSWSGDWEGRVAGSYEIAIVRREVMNAGSKRIEAYKLEGRSTFTGELEGRATLTVWIDPSTNLVVRSQGFTEAKSSIGRYETTFATMLRSGPGY